MPPTTIKTRSFPKSTSPALSQSKGKFRDRKTNSFPAGAGRHSKPAASPIDQDNRDGLHSPYSPTVTRDEACLAMSDDEDEQHTPPTSIEPDLFVSALELPVFDSESRSMPFRALFMHDLRSTTSPSTTSTPPADNTVYKYTLVVFIRNFFCGISQSYIRALISTLHGKDSEPNVLSGHQTCLLIIGHGHPSLIPVFIRELPPLPPGASVSTDPDKGVFSAAALGRTWSAGPSRPSFMEHGAVQSGFRMAARMVQHAGKGAVIKTFSGGDYAQNGGEFLVRNNEKVEVLWGHRMKNTRDHADVGQIIDVIERFAI